MQVDHIENDHIYILSNHVVAANPLFYNAYYCKRYLEKLDYYLGPLCEVLAYQLNNTEYQLVVKFRGRDVFEKYYKEKKKKQGKRVRKIPHSSYILSQAMANLQSSMAIHFNRREKRSGALFAARFRKYLIGSGDKLEEHMERVRKMEQIYRYSNRWRNRVKVKGFSGKRKGRVGNVLIHCVGGEGNGAEVLGCFRDYSKMELQGHFDSLPKKRISRKELKIFLEIRHKIRIR